MPSVQSPDQPGAEVVVAEVRAIEPVPSPTTALSSFLATPAGRAATVVASSFVAGAATVALSQRRTTRKAARRRRKAASALPIVGSQRFVVDVHLVGRD